MKVSLHPLTSIDDPTAFLWRLLTERPERAAISHKHVTMAEHARFVASHPYRAWMIVKNEKDIAVGSIYLTNLNEIGVFILREHQRHGYATAAIKEAMRVYPPLPAVQSVRSGRWLANIAPDNDGSKVLFRRLGFAKIQETYAL